MRIERTGAVEPLTPRIEKFLKQHLNAVSIDEVQSQETTRIDYECFDGQLAIELKTLEGDPGVRTENFMNELRKRPDFPYFLGRTTTKAVFSSLNDTGELQRDLVGRIGRTIINHLKKANEQLAAHDAAYPNQDRTRVVLLLNEDHSEYDPETVSYVISRAVTQKRDDGCWRYKNIDAIIYISERHVGSVKEYLAMPLSVINAPPIDGFPNKEQVISRFVAEWAQWNSRPLLNEQSKNIKFVPMEHIPDEMARHDMWRLNYRRCRHMQSWEDEEIFCRFDEIIVMISLMTFNSSPMKIDTKTQENLVKGAEWFRLFTEIQEELTQRGRSLEKGGLTPERLSNAAERLNLPKYARRFLKKTFMKRRNTEAN